MFIIARSGLFPERFAFFNYVAFFPELMAGPIDRATALLPQLHSPKKANSDKMIEGFGQIVFGCFKKLVVADNITTIVDFAYDENNIHLVSSLSLFIAVITYVFQLYCDFSGYTDIASGIGKLLGFDLKKISTGLCSVRT